MPLPSWWPRHQASPKKALQACGTRGLQSEATSTMKDSYVFQASIVTLTKYEPRILWVAQKSIPTFYCLLWSSSHSTSCSYPSIPSGFKILNISWLD
ncbi:Hypothetical protein NTJ_15680 [Nesidiocoris tenuis]|uniref:Uncharacterized protein n=1 Tax=Nesidiocoris tenuis TaxID=355587 RepID=A0ABN7BEU5_9HEMI|nr:Hypothetical protein NTJ_15680 [Nesidiocoris tenuis]